ncbi:MAG: hypothetical protein BWY56_02423 [Acidobacteria bacterium ADurb.Bin340]|nr:MAG: hypothetical protein BWY56_02423 [Acidobacteria bacterium ADurb.Bin340]
MRIVTCTSCTASLMNLELSLAFTTVTPCWASWGWSWARAASTACTMATVLPPIWRWRSRATAFWPSRRARVRRSFTPSTTFATSRSSMGRPLEFPTTTSSKSSTRRALASTFTAISRSVCSRLPLGMARVSWPRAPITCWRERPRDSSLRGSTCTRISRLLPPTTSTLPTPGMFSMRRLRNSSAMRVTSRSGISLCCSSGRSTSESTGTWEGSIFWTIGSSMVSGRSRRICPILPRTSSRALSMSRSSWNSTTTTPRLSWLVALISRTFSRGLRASSTFLTTSCSTASGLAPG